MTVDVRYGQEMSGSNHCLRLTFCQENRTQPGSQSLGLGAKGGDIVLLCSGKGGENLLNGGKVTYELAGLRLNHYQLIIKHPRVEYLPPLDVAITKIWVH